MMTNEIEKQFFDAFEIKAKKVRPFLCDKNQANIPCEFCIEKHGKCISQKEIYPEITDRILLELIVINNENAPAVGDTLEELRNQVLYWCIRYKNKIYTQVRVLFGMKD